MSDFKLHSVNWQDGMLITQQHLRDQERYFEGLARWYSVDFADRYGMIRRATSNESALALEIMESGDVLNVTVKRCIALTPDGSYIEIGGDEEEQVRARTTLAEEAIPVYLSVSRIDKKEVGDPDPSESIPRIPYRIPDYRLHLKELPNLSVGSYLQIAKLDVSGGEIRISEDYYPPCVSVNSDERLAGKVMEFRNRLENLLALSSRAYMAITVDGALAAEKTDLQMAFKDTAQRLAYHLASTLDDFTLGHNAIHPLHMVLFFKRLFRVFSTLLNILPELKDYLNEKHFLKEKGSEIGRFLSSIDSFLLSEYNHRDIGAHVSMIDDLLTDLRGVFAFLAQTRKEELGLEATAQDILTYSSRSYRLVNYRSLDMEQVDELTYLFFDIEAPQDIEDAVILMSKDLFDTSEWSSMQVRFGMNEARRLGETDPVDMDLVTFAAKVALHPHDILRSDSVNKMTLIFRGTGHPEKFADLGKLDLMVYAL